MTPEFQTTGIEDVVTRAGGRGALAQRIGVTNQALGQWLQRGWVPAARALELEAIYGVPRVRLLKPTLAALLPDAN